MGEHVSADISADSMGGWLVLELLRLAEQKGAQESYLQGQVG